jgi:hypothetical protein
MNKRGNRIYPKDSESNSLKSVNRGEIRLRDRGVILNI